MNNLNSDECAVYQLGETINLANADMVQARIEPFFTNDKLRTIVLDMEHVRLCDSYGLRLFINLQRKAGQFNKTLVLYRPDALMRGMFVNTRLDHIFTITDTLDSIA